jgi:hypothetical protein
MAPSGTVRGPPAAQAVRTGRRVAKTTAPSHSSQQLQLPWPVQHHRNLHQPTVSLPVTVDPLEPREALSLISLSQLPPLYLQASGSKASSSRTEDEAGAAHAAEEEAEAGPSSSFHVQVDERPPSQKNKPKHPDFYANVGYAIRALREDIPMLFIRDLNCASASQ